MIPNVLVDLAFVLALLAGLYSAYRAGWKDGRRWEAMRYKCEKYTGPIPMGDIQEREAHDL